MFLNSQKEYRRNSKICRKKKLLDEGYSEKDAEYYSDEFLNEKVYTAEEFYGNDFWKKPEFAEEPNEDLKQKHREKGTANKDNKDLLEKANALLGGNSQILLKYNDLPYFDVLKDEDKATYRIYTDGSDKFEKIKDAAKKEDEEPKEEVEVKEEVKEEPDELDAYTKDLEDYLDKNPDAKKKNYY